MPPCDILSAKIIPQEVKHPLLSERCPYPIPIHIGLFGNHLNPPIGHDAWCRGPSRAGSIPHQRGERSWEPPDSRPCRPSGGAYTAINDAGSNSTLTTLSSVGISEYLTTSGGCLKLKQPIRVQIVSAELDPDSSWRDDTRVIDIVLNPFETRLMSSYSTVCIYGQSVLHCTGISASASTSNDILSFKQYYVSIVISKTPSKFVVYVMKHSSYSSSEYNSSSQFSFRSSIPTNNASRNYYLVYI